MIASQRAYENRVERIKARMAQPRPDREDVRRDLLWLLAELEDTRAALAVATRTEVTC